MSDKIVVDMTEAMEFVSYCAQRLSAVSRSRALRFKSDFELLSDRGQAFDFERCDGGRGMRLFPTPHLISLLIKHQVAPELPDVVKKLC